MRAASLTPRCPTAARVGAGSPAAVRSRAPTVRASAAPAAATVKVADAAKATVQGTSRKVNEDRAVLEVRFRALRAREHGPWLAEPHTFAPARFARPSPSHLPSHHHPTPSNKTQPTGTSAAFSTYAAVFDGHGGSATADWLVANLAKVIDKNWDAAAPEKSLTAAFLAADRRLLAPGGLLGMGERGVGGSKCGSTAAVAAILAGGSATAPPTLLAAGVGDARVLLIRGGDGAVTQLTVDHVPDADEERERIERTNPNPKMPLVRWVGGTWRAGGILALSRAFGDA
jgi:hypothetical protein